MERGVYTERRTKIVCTIGPATGSVIERLVGAGMNVARLNLSHGTHDEHAGYIRSIRQAASRLKLPVAILEDLPGPKNRTGRLKESQVRLVGGADFNLTVRDVAGDESEVSVSLPNLPQDVRSGDVIFLDDGAIKLEVVSTTDTDIRCRVIAGGMLGWEKGINVPGVSLNVSSFTERDVEHLLFGMEQGVDFVALSFVREAADVLQVRKFLRQRGADIPIIAKVEKQEALEDIDDIVAAADGLMVARGDLGVEIPVQKVPMAQKEIVRKCNRIGKPVIVATQMLESMIDSPLPTRAEATDIANAIFDGADAIMLSDETAIGSYPLEATTMMAQIAVEAEAALPYERILQERGADLEPETDDAISYDACHTAHQLGAVAITAFTTSGSTAQRVARYRPRVPILAITPSAAVVRRLALTWGVYPHQVPEPLTIDELFAQGARVSVETGMARSGDLIVITAGIPIGVPGSTNILNVKRID